MHHPEPPGETKLQRLQRELDPEKTYVVDVSTTFVGRFSHFEEKDGLHIAVFITPGVTDKGNTPYRRIVIERLVNAAPVLDE